MTKVPTVKARTHHGTRSLDVTIPASVSDKFEIREGDVFSVDAEEKTGELVLKFKRVFHNK